MECLLISQCAPTLAGLKPASLFRWHTEHSRMSEELQSWNQRLQARGVCVRRLQTQPTFSLIYVYRPAMLQRRLQDAATADFLRGFGYTGQSLEADLAQLQQRLSACPAFPHEIGVFLGYPLEDVCGFIRNQGHNFRYSGCWKVYGDPEAAKRQFDAYRVCTDLLCRCYAQGAGAADLTAVDCSGKAENQICVADTFFLRGEA